MRNISGKRILSLLLVLAMLVGMVQVPVFAAEPPLTKSVMLYRDAKEDYSNYGTVSTSKNVRETTLNTWLDQISLAVLGVNYSSAVKIEYYVGQHETWYDLKDGIVDFKVGLLTLASGPAYWWFGYNAVDNTSDTGGTETEYIRVTYNGTTYGSNQDIRAIVRAYETVDYNINGTVTTVKTDVGSERAAAPTVAPITANGETKTFSHWTIDGVNAATPKTGTVTVQNAADVTYTAVYTSTYDVTFDTDGGSEIAKHTIADGATATRPADPTKEGYKFAGWYEDADCKTAFDFSKEITQPTTVYAKWNEIYTVSFNTDGGTPAAIDSQEVESGKTATKPADPVKTGYEFTGWFADGATTAFDFTTAITADTALKAGWAIESYTVTFDAKGGSNVAAQMIEYNKTASAPSSTMEGYTLSGWYTDADCKNKFDFATAITGDITLYAGWTINTYTVTWYDEDGTAVLATAMVNHGATPTFPADGKQPSKDGWNFLAWAPEMGPVTANTSYRATYTEKATYDVTWANTELDPTPVVDGEKVTPPADPSKDGHTFGGWYADAALSTAFNFDTAIKADTTVYAKWTANNYTVTFNTNDGSAVAAQTIAYNKTATKPADPTKTGYTFAGWYKDAALQTAFDFATAIVEDITLYADWTINKYTVSFNSNDGSDVAAQTIEYNKTATKPVDPTKTGYTFDGWYTDAALTTAYDFTASVTADVTLNAKWTPNTFTVSFQTNGGSAVDVQTVEYKGTAVKPSADPTLTGYTFGGWYADENCTVAFDFNTKITTNTILYAQWKINKYNVTFNANNGTNATVATVDYNKTVAEPPAPTLKGYTFMGWFAAGATAAYEFSTPVTADITLTAQWVKDPVATTITADTPAAVTYGYDAAALKAAIGAVVTDTETGLAIQNAAVTYVPSIDNLPAGEYDVTVKFAATKDYLASSTTVKVTVNKAAAPEVTVKSQTIKYGQGFEHADPISTTPDVNTIDFVAGLDVHDETNLLGLVQVGMEISDYAKAMLKGLGYDLSNLTYEQFKTLLGYVANGLNGVGALIDGVDGAAVEKLINALQTYKDSLPVDTEIRISVVDAITLPTNVGVYLVGAVTANNNYETALGAGYLVITPNGMKVELSWNYNDENGILTIPAFKTGAFDLTAKATLIDSTLEGADGTAAEAAEHLEYIYIGVDADGELILSRTLDLNSRAGVYAEVAYIANWDNAMYYAVPIARTLLLAPGVADVAFIDVNGNKNYAQAFEYDGQPKPMKTVVTGGNGNGTLTVKYIGIDGHADGYNRTDAPTEAGLYAVVATYTEYVDGKLEIVGGAVGALMIEQVEPGQFAFEKEHTLVEFDGQTHFPTILSDLSYDYVTLAIDRDTNTVYVTLPDDVNDHIAKLPEEVQAKIAELTAMVKDGDVKTETVKTALNDAIDQLIAINMEAKATEVINKVIDEVTAEFNTRIDVDALKAKLNAEINTLKQSVKDKLPEEIASMLEQYITVNTDKVDVDVEGLKAELKAVVAKLEGILPAEAVEELKLLVEKVVGVVNGNAQVNEIKTTVQQILDKLETLEVPDAETLVKLLVGAAVNKVDAEQLKTVINAVVDKVKSQEVLDEAVALVKDVAAIYGGKIDTSAVEATVKALIEKIKAKAESGQLDDNDLANLEVEVDNVFASLKDIVNQVPDATIVAGNPSKVGKYDCYALNISANYKPTLIESKMTIYNPGTITLTPKSLGTMYSGVEQSVSGFNKMTINGTEINVAGLTTVEFTMGNAVYTLDLSGVSASAKGTNAGEYAVVVTGTPVVKNAKGEDVTAQFTVEYDTTTTLTITKRNVKLTSATASKKFDGKPLTASTVKVEGDGFADGQGFEYVVTGTQTAVGSSENKFTYTFTGTDEQKANYIFTVVLGTLTVTLDDLTTITVEANSGEFEYDGAAKTVEGFKTLTFGINGKTYTVSGISAKATATDAGTYEVKIEGTPVVSDADGVNVTAMFEVLLVNGKLTITAAAKEEVLPPMIPTAAIVVSANEGGFVSNIGRNIVVFGTEHTFNVKPNAGYVIADVLVNGVSVGAIDTVTVRARTRVTTIDVVFAAAPQFPFTDVAPTEWYYDDVKYVWEQGLMNGTAGDAFSPLASTTRAMIVTILWRLEGSPVMESAADFFDVEANVWYSQAISWASANGIVNGYGNGLFGPMDNITREQVAAIFCRYAAYKGIDTTAKAELGKDIKYTPWAADVLGWAEAVDLYDVVDRDTNDRTAAADRAEIAAYLRCLCEIVK